jgi:Tol biopolymer transport system component
MNADGSHQRRLTHTPGRDYPGAWSPDGKQLAFSSQRSGNFDVFVMNADGSGQHQLTHAADQEGPAPGYRTAASFTRASTATNHFPAGT